MGVRAGGHNATAQRAAIALHIQTAYKSIKKTRGEPMPPNLVMVTSQADNWANPLKILTLLKNVLEDNVNKIYHEAIL